MRIYFPLFIPKLVSVRGCSVMFGSSQPHGLQPVSLLCPLDFSGKNTRLPFPPQEESSQPRNQAQVSCIGSWILYHWATREAPKLEVGTEISDTKTSPMDQWLRISLLIQGTQVWSLVRGLRSHMLQSDWAQVLDPTHHDETVHVPKCWATRLQCCS